MYPIHKATFDNIMTKFQTLDRSKFNRYYRKNKLVLQYFLKMSTSCINKSHLDYIINDDSDIDLNYLKPNKSDFDSDYKYQYTVVHNINKIMFIDNIYIYKDLFDYKKFLVDYYNDPKNSKDIQFYLDLGLKYHKKSFQKRILKELTEYYYHPKRMDKWIHEIED
jgi:hypothetical protein